MKKQTRKVLLALALVAMLLLATSSATAARPIKTYYEATEYQCSQEGPAEEWYSDDGTIWYAKGIVGHDIVVSDEPCLNGTATLNSDGYVDLTTGSGHLWGREVYQVTGGTWTGLYHGPFTDFFTDFNYLGHLVGYGAGDLQGQVIFMEAQSVPVPEDNPCPDGVALYTFALSGYILER